jgi:hypothetical protein
MIVAALSARRPSLMARPEWSAVRNLCFKDDNSSSSALLYLLDVLAQIPKLYYEQDIIMSQYSLSSANSTEEDSYSSGIQSLLNQPLELLGHIHSKMREWKSSHPNSISSRLPCTNIPSSQPYPSTSVTYFSSINAANVSILYSSVVVLLNQLVFSLYQLLPLNNPNIDACRLASNQTSLAILDILKSIDYQLTFSEPAATFKSSVSSSRSFYLLLPIRIAHRVLAQSTLPENISQRIWLEDVSSFIEVKFGPWASNKNLIDVKK